MTAAAGRFLILAALLLSSAGAIVGFAAGARRSASGWRLTSGFAYARSKPRVVRDESIVSPSVSSSRSVGRIVSTWPYSHR